MVGPGLPSEAQAAARIVRLTGLPYFVVDADRNVVEVSPALTRLTGFEADDVVGRSCLRLHRCTECLRGCGVFDNRIVTDKDLQLYRADGSTVRVRKSGRVFLDDQGEITGALEIVEPFDPSDEVDVRDPLPPEALRIRAALERARFRRVEAARILGMSRTTLWRKMNEYGLHGPDEHTRTES